LALKGTEWAEAQVDTIRLKLFKIGALVRISARRVWLELSSTYPWKQIYAKAFDALRCSPSPPQPNSFSTQTQEPAWRSYASNPTSNCDETRHTCRTSRQNDFKTVDGPSRRLETTTQHQIVPL